MWYTYICQRQDKLYVGITTDLGHRMRQHRARLLYSESHENKGRAACRERELEGWRRDKKLAVIRASR